jgi:hypothetical protein
MKRLVMLFSAVTLANSLGHAEETYSGLGWICVGGTSPSGNYADALNSGIDMEAYIMQPRGPNVGVGLGIHFSQLDYKSSDYDGTYRVLFSNGYVALGSFTPSSGIFWAGVIGAGLRFAFKAERKPNYSTFPSYSVPSSTTIAEPNSGYWLGAEVGGIIGYRLSKHVGICGKVQYDVLTKFIEGSSYFSAKAGLFFGLN